MTKAKLAKANPYLDSVKIEIEWKLGDESFHRKEVVMVIEEIRDLLGEWGGEWSLKETTGK